MPTPGEDRAYIIEQYQYLFGQNPTAAELDQQAAVLQSGVSREDWMRAAEKAAPEWSVRMVYRKTLGREPTAAELALNKAKLESGEITRRNLTEYLAGTSEALLKPPPGPVATPGQEDARAILDNTLALYGLNGLSEWGWQQIQAGHSPERVLSDLRQTPEYKARFPAMETRRAAGLPPIDEATYVSYEAKAREILRRNGMPPGFWDSPQDFTSLIAKDISPQELSTRIEQGWRRVADAPQAVRDAFQVQYGPSGDQALAAFFVDPDKAEPLLLKAAETARISGFGNVFGLSVDKTRAEELLSYGKTSEQVVDAYNRLATVSPLFQESVSEDEDLTAEDEGLNATLGLDATSANTIERRGRTRSAATAGGGGALVGSRGVAAGQAE